MVARSPCTGLGAQHYDRAWQTRNQDVCGHSPPATKNMIVIFYRYRYKINTSFSYHSSYRRGERVTDDYRRGEWLVDIHVHVRKLRTFNCPETSVALAPELRVAESRASCQRRSLRTQHINYRQANFLQRFVDVDNEWPIQSDGIRTLMQG